MALALLVPAMMAAQARADFGAASFSTTLHQPAPYLMDWINGVPPFPALTPVTQAGSHPDLTTEFLLNTVTTRGGANGIEAVKDVDTNLPAGFYGNPQATPTCSVRQLNDRSSIAYGCPTNTQVGIAWVLSGPDASDPNNWVPFPVFNLTPRADEAAELVFSLFAINTSVRIGVRTEGDYGLRATVRNVPEFSDIYGMRLTLWGVPADPVHDSERVDPTGMPGAASLLARRPFLTAPANCSAPLTSELRLRSWYHRDNWVATTTQVPQPTGCEALDFDAGMQLRPQHARTGEPAGYDVDLHVKQNDDPDGLSTPTVRRVSVTLPEGVSISPPSATGLDACSDAQAMLGSAEDVRCPETSKLGSVSITTPLLADPLVGDVYLRSPQPGNLFRLLIVARGAGMVIKLPGEAHPDAKTGQITARFDDTPQLPFSDMHLEFRGGDRAPLTTPKACGTYTTHAELTSWTGKTVSRDDSMRIDQGCDRAGKFEPTLDAGVTNAVAGGSSSFVLNVGRPSGQQDIGSMNITLPPGVLARVGSVPLCPDAEAAAGTCAAASQVGKTTILSGAGPSPLSIPQAGKPATAVYLAGPYKGAPYSLSIVVPAQAGPFDLGTVVVRAALFIDPVDAHVTVQSDPIPTILQGVPLDVQKINVTMDRPGFMVSPTSCDPMQISGQVTSAQGTAVGVQSRFQVADCASLDLKPRLALSLSGKGQTTDNKHPGLSASLTMPSGHANLKKVAVTLPLSLALDPENSQSGSLCEFDAGRKTIPDCPKSSIVGTATARTPLLNQPLRGPVYFVKNVRTDAKTGRRNRTLPTLAIPLQGAGITLVLRASSAVVDDHLVTTFDKIPDAPVSDFELHINGGKKGILVVSGADVCKATQTAGQAAQGHNGKTADAQITMSTPCGLAVVASGHTPGSLKLTVGGIGAGKVAVSGKEIADTSRTIRTATTATLQPRLSKAAQSTLAHGHNVKTRVTVSFRPKGTKKAKTIHKTLIVHGAKK